MTGRTAIFVKWFVRVICGAIIMLYSIFRISMPLIKNEPLYLDENDGYVLFFTFLLLVLLEIVIISLRGAITGAITVFFKNILNKFKTK